MQVNNIYIILNQMIIMKEKIQNQWQNLQTESINIDAQMYNLTKRKEIVLQKMALLQELYKETEKKKKK